MDIENVNYDNYNEILRRYKEYSEYKLFPDMNLSEEGKIHTALNGIINHVVNGKMQHDNLNLLFIAAMALQLQNAKEKTYGRSWVKHGNISAFMNLERKWDRIFNIMENVIKEGEQSLYKNSNGESILDTIFDLGCYAFLWVGYLMETDTEAGNKFIDRIKQFVLPEESAAENN